MTTVIFGILATIVLLLLTIGLINMKSKLYNFGDAWISKFLGAFWIFILIPLGVILPYLLVSANSDQDLEQLSRWAPGAIFLLFMSGVSAFSIFLNHIYKLL